MGETYFIVWSAFSTARRPGAFLGKTSSNKSKINFLFNRAYQSQMSNFSSSRVCMCVNWWFFFGKAFSRLLCAFVHSSCAWVVHSSPCLCGSRRIVLGEKELDEKEKVLFSTNQSEANKTLALIYFWESVWPEKYYRQKWSFITLRL